MKKVALVLMMLIWLLPTSALKARAQEVDISVFFDALAPYGEWLTLSPYGWVWCPYDVAPGWRPYTDGDWYYSDYGWAFDSPEPWAWAVYHYGRWTYDPECGWAWVPGNVWGPAWVAWRYGTGYIGWAPLPPMVGWSFGLGLELGGYDLDNIGWSGWCFIGLDRFGQPGMHSYIYGVDRNMGFLRETRNITSYGFQGNRVFNRGFDPQQLERETHRTIPRYQILSAPGTGNRVTQFRGNEMRLFRPNITSSSPRVLPKNVIPPHVQVAPEVMLRRHKLENQTLSQHNQGLVNNMNKHHNFVMTTPHQGTTTNQLQERHRQELQFLQNHNQTESHILENRHKKEITMNNNWQSGGNASHPAPPKKKH